MNQLLQKFIDNQVKYFTHRFLFRHLTIICIIENNEMR